MPSETVLQHNRRYIPGGISSVNRSIDPAITFVRGEGAYLWDNEGKRYIDYHAGFAPYFLTVHDIVAHARSLDPPILCQGRGSAANSLVCYFLGITPVDPVRERLLFSRFLSEQRDEPRVGENRRSVRHHEPDPFREGMRVERSGDDELVLATHARGVVRGRVGAVDAEAGEVRRRQPDGAADARMHMGVARQRGADDAAAELGFRAEVGIEEGLRRLLCEQP